MRTHSLLAGRETRLGLAVPGNTASWTDMSDYVVHFTRSATHASASDVLAKILNEGYIAPANARLGIFRHIAPERWANRQTAACLTEVPFHLLGRIIANRSHYGIGFHQAVMHRRQAARVWYVEKNTIAANSLWTLANHYATSDDTALSGSFWQLAPLIDMPGRYSGTKYSFEFEREWRSVEGLNFEAAEVGFLFLPESEHSSVSDWMQNATVGYDQKPMNAMLIDPIWSQDRIQSVIDQAAAPPY